MREVVAESRRLGLGHRGNVHDAPSLAGARDPSVRVEHSLFGQQRRGRHHRESLARLVLPAKRVDVRQPVGLALGHGQNPAGAGLDSDYCTGEAEAAQRTLRGSLDP